MPPAPLPPIRPPGYPSFNNGDVEAVRDHRFRHHLLHDAEDRRPLHLGRLCTAVRSTPGRGTRCSTRRSTSTGTNANSYCQAGQNISTTDTGRQLEPDRGLQRGRQRRARPPVRNRRAALGAAVALAVDIARSSKPATTGYCAGLVGAGYAKDAVDPVEFQLNPSALAPAATSATYSSVNGGVLGPVTGLGAG